MGTYWSGGGVGEVSGSFDPVMPNHQHTVPDHLHRVDIWSAGRNAAHVHGSLAGAFTTEGHGDFNTPFHYLPVGVGTDIGGPHYLSFYNTTGGEHADHAHAVNGWSGASDRSLSSGFAGGGAQIPPGVAFNFIIRAR